jgi:predicted SprT family Zn-dependent metalloprotease
MKEAKGTIFTKTIIIFWYKCICPNCNHEFEREYYNNTEEIIFCSQCNQEILVKIEKIKP